MRFFHKLRSVFDEFGAKGPLYLLTRALEGTPFGVHAYHLVGALLVIAGVLLTTSR